MIRALRPALLVAGLTACGGGNDPDLGAIRLGLVAPLSGDLAAGGPDIEASIRLAIDEINSAGGVLERELELDVRDDGSTERGAAEAYAGLLSDRASAILGPTHSAGVLAAMNQIRAGITLTISGSATSQALTNVEDGGYFFRTVASDAAQAIVLAQRIADEGRERLCLVYRDDVYGSGLAEALRLRMQPTSVEIVESRYDPTGSSLVRVMDACEPIREQPNSGVVFITFQADGRLIMDDAAARGWNTTTHRIFLVDGNRRIQLFEALANRAAFTGAIGTASASAEPETAAGRRLSEFRDRFMQRHGRLVGGFGANHYDTVYLAALAIQLAGDDDDHVAIRDAINSSSTGRQEACNDWPAIRAALAADGQVDYLGASGEVDLDLSRTDAGGDLLPPFFIQIWAFDGSQIVEREVVTVPRT